MNRIKIGTRASNLAIYQAEKVSSSLEKSGFRTEIVKISSDGDRSLGGNLSQNIGQFVTAVDMSLIIDDVDITVHSSKDVPADYYDGLISPLAYLERGPMNDILLHRELNEEKMRLDQVLKNGSTTPLDEILNIIPFGGKIGSSSVRRQSFILSHRMDLLPIAVRGNVETRIQRLIDGRVDGLILAEAGLSRLLEVGMLSSEALSLGAFRIPTKSWPAAPGQGAICVHCPAHKKNHFSKIKEILNHKNTEDNVTTEKEILRGLGGGCQFPAGVESKNGDVHGIIAPENWREAYSLGTEYELMEIGRKGNVKNPVLDVTIDPVDPVISEPRIFSTLNSDRMARILATRGVPMVNMPVIELQTIAKNWPFLKIDGSSPKSTWPILVLTSPFSVRATTEMLDEIPNLSRIAWLAIGEGTARACFRAGHPASICADARNRDELFEFIVKNLQKNTPLYIPMSTSAPKDFPSSLRSAGYEVFDWNAYSNNPRQISEAEITMSDLLLISSPSSAISWAKNGLPVPEKVICMGQSTKTSIELLDAFSNSEVSVLNGPTLKAISDFWNKNGGEENEAQD